VQNTGGMTKTRILLLTALTLLTVVAAGCGRSSDTTATTGATTGASGSELSGRIEADGSSTVAPFTTAAAEGFQAEHPQVQVTVGVSGTGGGFERFCAGEIDIADASRAIEADEQAACTKNGVDYLELQIANDAITVVVNPQNLWADCITTAELKQIWAPGSKVDSWNDVRAGWPDVLMSLFGPGTDSGTFDFFTKEIVGKEGASRSDYQASEDDNVLVTGVAGEEGALGYFGFSYYEQNQDKLKALAIDAGDGCMEPSVANAQNGTYKPLSRPLYVYVKQDSLARAEVAAFVTYMLAHETEISQQAQYVPLTDAQLRQAKDGLAAALQA
jgi:phosphate transport system substrate-binding protein